MIGDVEDVTARLKRRARRLAAAQAALEESVLEAHREGQSLREIGKIVSMSPEGVRKMLARLGGEQAETPHGQP